MNDEGGCRKVLLFKLNNALSLKSNRVMIYICASSRGNTEVADVIQFIRYKGYVGCNGSSLFISRCNFFFRGFISL